MASNLRGLWPWLLLDLAGSALAGLGLADQLAHTGLVPEAWRFPQYGWAMVAAGLALTVPFNREILRRARTGQDRKPGIPGIDAE